jgi:hypothetical protein
LSSGGLFTLTRPVHGLFHKARDEKKQLPVPGNTKGGSITVPLTSCLTVLD